ncbi:curli assembly protein CsgE [Salmonella enterica subsp. enterica serovar Montevideo str. IA_2010008287]|nr:curli assembly protein CsgE [Salmonella enterica subsp. enterica serovar Montevideo str. IA_2010008287]
MKRYLTWIVAAELLFATGNLHANEVEVEVPGLLTDHTVSSIGHEFYRAFSDKWESEYTGNLTINERPQCALGKLDHHNGKSGRYFPDFFISNEKRLRENRRLRISANRGSIKSPTNRSNAIKYE